MFHSYNATKRRKGSGHPSYPFPEISICNWVNRNIAYMYGGRLYVSSMKLLNVFRLNLVRRALKLVERNNLQSYRSSVLNFLTEQLIVKKSLQYINIPDVYLHHVYFRCHFLYNIQSAKRNGSIVRLHFISLCVNINANVPAKMFCICCKQIRENKRNILI
jgi:hypothetical protein